eukprot:TRINITY_DN9417_c0_g1_i2.p1 TRINITY_DN9417_c0_g1~~TRINITY_DN9417_c0_g1_i2.p1  ORF type:complete len:400 (+),score=118.31 TRINITY_DN9417_c0_g1_i2:135-1334(+)
MSSNASSTVVEPGQPAPVVVDTIPVPLVLPPAQPAVQQQPPHIHPLVSQQFNPLVENAPVAIIPAEDNSPAPSKGKRRQLTLQEKIAICKAISEQQGLTQSDLAERYHCSHSTISKILKNKDRWDHASSLTSPPKVRIREPKFPLVEEALNQWYIGALVNRVAIGDDVLKEKARMFHKMLDPSDEQFKCSDGWLANFKQRHEIHGVKLHSEVLALPANIMLALPAAPHNPEPAADGTIAPPAPPVPTLDMCDMDRIVQQVREHHALDPQMPEPNPDPRTHARRARNENNVAASQQALADAELQVQVQAQAQQALAEILHHPSTFSTPTSSSSTSITTTTISGTPLSALDESQQGIELMKRTIAYLEQTGRADDVVSTLRSTMRQLEEDEANSPNKRQKS